MRAEFGFTTPTGATSPEGAALALLQIIASIEGKSFDGQQSSPPVADRAWVLETFAECLKAARNDSTR